MPGYNEIADIDVINGNMDKIDVQMKKNADSAQQSKDIVSDEYSATNTYAVGDYCIHENVLYKCKTAITTGEAFDSSKWVQTTCGTEFGELNSNLREQQDNGYLAKNLININREDENGWSYSEIKHYKGTFTLSSSNAEVNTAYCIDGWHDLPHTFTCDDEFDIIFPKPMSVTKNCVQLEKGTVATQFVPYFPPITNINEGLDEIKNDLSEQFHNRIYSGTLSECVSSVAKAIADGQSTTFNFIRENDSYYFGFVGRFTENLIGGLMTNSSGAVYKIGGSVESPTTTQM